LAVLLAVSVDANNHAVMIAWAIVEGESESSWRWFLSHLHTGIPNINNPLTTMISDRDKGLLKADNEIPLVNHALYVEHISRNLQNTYGLPSRLIFNQQIRHVLTEQKVQAGFAAVHDTSPNAAEYLEDIPLILWSSLYLLGKRYGHNISNLVEVMNKWMLEEWRMCVLDLLHSLWSKSMDLRFRRLQEAKIEDEKGAILTKHMMKLLQESMDHALIRNVRYADADNTSVHTYSGK